MTGKYSRALGNLFLAILCSLYFLGGILYTPLCSVVYTEGEYDHLRLYYYSGLLDQVTRMLELSSWETVYL